MCTALRLLGQHLSGSASQLLVAPTGGAHLALHMKGLHPLVVHADELAASPVLPGVLDKDLTPQVMVILTLQLALQLAQLIAQF